MCLDSARSLHKALSSFRPPQVILEIEGSTTQVSLMKEKRVRDAAVISKHHLLKRLASTRAPGEAVLGKVGVLPAAPPPPPARYGGLPMFCAPVVAALPTHAAARYSQNTLSGLCACVCCFTV